MSGQTFGTNGGEDNELIRSMRSQIDELTAELKSVRDATADEVRREYQAKDLLGKEYGQLAPYVAKEVEGELSSEAVSEWLAAKGLAANPSPAPKTEETPKVSAADVDSVSNLGGAAAAASVSNNEPSIHERLEEVKSGFAGKVHASNMPEFTANVARTLQG